MRRQLKIAASLALSSTGGDRLLGAIAGKRRVPLIVNYHRVVKDFTAMKDTSIPAMLITSRIFEQQVDWIARRFRITSLDEIGSHLASGRPFSEQLAAITFDDGYADLYHNAFPVLRRKGIPAAVFVVTDLIGTNQMQNFDRLYLLLASALDRPSGIDWLRRGPCPRGIPADIWKRLSQFPGDAAHTAYLLMQDLQQAPLELVLQVLHDKFPTSGGCPESHRTLDWRMLGEMSDAGITVGSHTRTHPILTLEGSTKVREEIEGSAQIIRQQLGREVHHFAYPDGRFNSEIVAGVKRAGYRYAYGVCQHRSASDPLLTIPRRTLWENACADGRRRFSPSVMSCNTNGIFDLFQRCRRDHQAASVTAHLSLPGVPATSAARDGSSGSGVS